MEEVLASEAGGVAYHLEEELNLIPLALHVDVTSGLKLAAFLGALRAFAEQSSPGLVEWIPETEGELRFVRVTSSAMGDDFSLYYGTTSEALVVSLNRPTLIRAMQRDVARKAAAEDGGEPPVGREAAWGGASLGLELDLSAAALVGAFGDVNPVEQLRLRAWSFLPILNAWRALDPGSDPVEFHERYWGRRPACPGGGEFRWSEALGTMRWSRSSK